MTKEEIKATTSMRDVVERYGFRPNRAGFINCPFHDGDRTASLKIYPDSFHCYGCGAHGDIFDFVRLAERCDFKTAFRILGGDSGKMSDAAVLRIARQRERKKAEDRQKAKKKEQYFFFAERLRVCEETIQQAEPYSDEWTRETGLLPELRERVESLYQEVCDLIEKR